MPVRVTCTDGVLPVTVTEVAVAVAVAPAGEVPATSTVSARPPASTMAWVMVTVTVHVVLPPTGSEVARQVGVPSTVSVSVTLVRATGPVLVIV